MFNVQISHHAQWCIWLAKVHWMTPKWPLQAQGQKVPIMAYYIKPPSPKLSSASLLDVALLSYQLILWKVHQMIPKSPDMFKVKSTHMHTSYTPWGPKLSSDSLYDEPFLSYAPFGGEHFNSAPNNPQMTLTCSRLKVPICMQHTPPKTKFSFISLYDEPFLSYESIFVKSAPNVPQMTLPCSGLKVPACIQHTPQWPKFSSVSLYDEPFLNYAPFWLGKVHQMIPNELDMFKVKNTNMQHTPLGPKFSHILLYVEPFLSYKPVLWKCTEWPKIDLARFKIKGTHMHSPWPKHFLPASLYDEPFSSYAPFLGNVHWMANSLARFKVKRTHMYPRGPNFHPFYSMMSSLWATSLF